MKKECLINNEGCNLGIQRNKNNELEIFDQWGLIVWRPTLGEFVQWLQGKGTILDSQDNSWSYTEWVKRTESATDLATIIKFLIDSNREKRQKFN